MTELNSSVESPYNVEAIYRFIESLMGDVDQTTLDHILFLADKIYYQENERKIFNEAKWMKTNKGFAPIFNGHHIREEADLQKKLVLFPEDQRFFSVVCDCILDAQGDYEKNGTVGFHMPWYAMTLGEFMPDEALLLSKQKPDQNDIDWARDKIVKMEREGEKLKTRNMS